MTDKQLQELNKQVQQDADTWLTRLVHALMIAVSIIAIGWTLAIYLNQPHP